MFCSKCGNELAKEAVFCQRCGLERKNNTDMINTVNVTAQEPRQTPTEKQVMEKKCIGVMLASMLGIISLFFPWISVNLGLGMNFSFNLFNLTELMEWGQDAPGTFVWGAYIILLLFIASFIVVAVYDDKRLNPHKPYLKMVPLIVAILGLIISITFVIQGNDVLSSQGMGIVALSIFDFLGIGFYLFLIASIILFVYSLALSKL